MCIFMMAANEIAVGNFQISEHQYDLDYSDQNEITVTDKSGNTLIYQEFEGVIYARLFKLSLIKQIRSFRLRPDDIYFTAYPRTGTHWTFELTSMLLNGKAETIPCFKEHLELTPHEDFENLPSPRIINAHMKLSDSPDDVKLKRVKVLYTLRDPKDVAVSLYKLYYGRRLTAGTYLGTFEDFLHLFITEKVDFNGIFEHLRDAEKFFEDNPDIPVHFQRYEDTSEDPVGAVQKISDFLGLSRNDELCRDIAEKCQFSKMKVDKDKFSLKVDGENFLYRKGTVGDWRNYFTDKMLDEYYRVYDEKMMGSRFYHYYAKEKDDI